MLLAAVMLLTMMPLGAAAAETDTSERDELIALACEVFPEYAQVIRNEVPGNNVRIQSNVKVQVVSTETRAISDNRTLSYTQLSNGAAILTENIYVDDIIESTATGSGGIVTKTCTVKIACTHSPGVFTLSGIIYKTLSSGYAVIENAGVATVSPVESVIYDRVGVTYYQSANKPAEIVYDLAFVGYTGQIEDCAYVLIEISGNTMEIVIELK